MSARFALPLLEPRKANLELCTYCPKLCRTACPVSNAEPRETLTPWGKMTTAYFGANGSAPANEAIAAPAWACTGCGACTEMCVHKNDVSGTLFDARHAWTRDASVGPASARRVVANFGEHLGRNRDGVRELRAIAGARARDEARDHLLVGCAYVTKARPEASAVLESSAALGEGSVRPLEACCGLPLLLAGDRDRFRAQAKTFAQEAARAERIIVADAGCARALRETYPAMGIAIAADVITLVELAAAKIEKLARVHDVRRAVVRYHDPCQLGRGLGIYDAPRAVLTRLLGRAPDEFARHRDNATCAGAGGLVPVTMPEVARTMAARRVNEAEIAGDRDARIVTACASSLVAMRKAGAIVDDIATWIARGVRGRA